METFIIGYMIMNEIVGVAIAIGYVKYLQKSGFPGSVNTDDPDFFPFLQIKRSI